MGTSDRGPSAPVLGPFQGDADDARTHDHNAQVHALLDDWFARDEAHGD